MEAGFPELSEDHFSFLLDKKIVENIKMMRYKRYKNVILIGPFTQPQIML
jgi:hypothetical protein